MMEPEEISMFGNQVPLIKPPQIQLSEDRINCNYLE